MFSRDSSERRASSSTPRLAQMKAGGSHRDADPPHRGAGLSGQIHEEEEGKEEQEEEEEEQKGKEEQEEEEEEQKGKEEQEEEEEEQKGKEEQEEEEEEQKGKEEQEEEEEEQKGKEEGGGDGQGRRPRAAPARGPIVWGAEGAGAREERRGGHGGPAAGAAVGVGVPTSHPKARARGAARRGASAGRGLWGGAHRFAARELSARAAVRRSLRRGACADALSERSVGGVACELRARGVWGRGGFAGECSVGASRGRVEEGACRRVVAWAAR
ncbi:unnamed protein product [Boreogadus saida]